MMTHAPTPRTLSSSFASVALLALLAPTLSGCFSQSPAPVISGYQRHQATYQGAVTQAPAPEAVMPSAPAAATASAPMPTPVTNWRNTVVEGVNSATTYANNTVESLPAVPSAQTYITNIEPAAGPLAVSADAYAAQRAEFNAAQQKPVAEPVPFVNGSYQTANYEVLENNTYTDTLSQTAQASFETVKTTAQTTLAPVQNTLANGVRRMPGFKSHYLSEGETVYAVAKQYGVDVKDILRSNNINDVSGITVGTLIKIPTVMEFAGNSGAVFAPVNTEASRIIATNEWQPIAQPIATANVVETITPNTPTTTQTITETVAAPVTHILQKNQTLYRVGLKYGVTPKAIMAANGITDPTRVSAGMKLTIPNQTKTVTRPTSQPVSVAKPLPIAKIEPAAAPAPKPVAKAAPVQKAVNDLRQFANVKGYIWPAKGTIVQNFGKKSDGTDHSGINIKLPTGTPVRAAENGTVIYADDGLKTYGNLVLIRHANNFVTAYAHNSQLAVKKNDKVKKGQIIAKSGQTGSVDTPQLHFEVRKNARPVNPLTKLPKS